MGREPPGPWSTVDWPPLPVKRAHWSSAYGHFGALGRRPRAGEGDWRTGNSMGPSPEIRRQRGGRVMEEGGGG
jgi:hypothetical protein